MSVRRPGTGASPARIYPALDAWRAELAWGERTPTTLDALYRAACAEANAREFEGIPALWRGFMEESRTIIAEAIREEGGRA